MASEFMALLDQRGRLKEEGDGIIAGARAAGRGMTEEELTRLDEIEAGMTSLSASIDREQRWREQTRNMPAMPADPEPGTASLPASPIPSAAEFKGPRLFASLGDQLQAIWRASQPGVQGDRRLLDINAAAQGAGENVGADGGFVVQQDFVNAIERRLYVVGEVLSRVRRLPISSNSNGISLPAIDETSRVTGSRYGGVTGYWVDEGTAATASRPKLRKMELKLKKVMALGYATDELLADAPAMSALFEDAFGEELIFLCEDAIFNGGGQGSPLGILNAVALVTQAAEGGQTATTVVTNNIVKMRARLRGANRRNSVWYINQDVEPQLHTMSMVVSSGGVPTYLPMNGLSAEPYDTLYGRPVIPVEYCPTLGQVGDVLYCDPTQYLVIDKGGVQQASSMHVAFSTDEQAFRATYRIDGQPIWSAALTPFKGTNTQSAFVAIAAR